VAHPILDKIGNLGDIPKSQKAKIDNTFVDAVHSAHPKLFLVKVIR